MAALGVDETVAARVSVDGGRARARRRPPGRRGTPCSRRSPSASARGVVLLGHTRDDQAETVLLGLTRGSGGRSLAGMRRAFDVYRRPLLDVARADTVTACQVRGHRRSGTTRTTPTRGFTRARVRGTGAAGARGGARPGRRRDAGPHRRPAARRHGPARRPGRGRRWADAAVDGSRSTALLATCRPPYAAGCCGWPRCAPARRPPSCSTSTCSRWTPWSPTGTARSGSTCPASSAAPGRGRLMLGG